MNDRKTSDWIDAHFGRILLTYLIVGLLVFGWVYNHTECRTWKLGTIESSDCSAKTLQGMIAGIFWPVMIPLVLAVKVTKWP